jgi:hypothetical protein
MPSPHYICILITHENISEFGETSAIREPYRSDMAMNFERDEDARGGPSLSFRHYPAIFMENRTQPGIETRCTSSGTR